MTPNLYNLNLDIYLLNELLQLFRIPNLRGLWPDNVRWGPMEYVPGLTPDYQRHGQKPKQEGAS
jgi:hypothetical protein